MKKHLNNYLIENSMFTDAAGRAKLVPKDPDKTLGNLFVINFLGFLALYQVNPKHSRLVNYLRKYPVKIGSIDDTGSDLTLIIKILNDEGILNDAYTTRYTKLLALMKQGSIDKLDEEVIKDLLKPIKFSQMWTSPKLYSLVNSFKKGDTNLLGMIKPIYEHARRLKYADEFRDVARHVVHDINDPKSPIVAAVDTGKPAAPVTQPAVGNSNTQQTVPTQAAAPVTPINPPPQPVKVRFSGTGIDELDYNDLSKKLPISNAEDGATIFMRLIDSNGAAAFTSVLETVKISLAELSTNVFVRAAAIRIVDKNNDPTNGPILTAAIKLFHDDYISYDVINGPLTRMSPYGFSNIYNATVKLWFNEGRFDAKNLDHLRMIVITGAALTQPIFIARGDNVKGGLDVIDKCKKRLLNDTVEFLKDLFSIDNGYGTWIVQRLRLNSSLYGNYQTWKFFLIDTLVRNIAVDGDNIDWNVVLKACQSDPTMFEEFGLLYARMFDFRKDTFESMKGAVKAAGLFGTGNFAHGATITDFPTFQINEFLVRYIAGEIGAGNFDYSFKDELIKQGGILKVLKEDGRFYDKFCSMLTKDAIQYSRVQDIWKRGGPIEILNFDDGLMISVIGQINIAKHIYMSGYAEAMITNLQRGFEKSPAFKEAFIARAKPLDSNPSGVYNVGYGDVLIGAKTMKRLFGKDYLQQYWLDAIPFVRDNYRGEQFQKQVCFELGEDFFEKYNDELFAVIFSREYSRWDTILGDMRSFGAFYVFNKFFFTKPTQIEKFKTDISTQIENAGPGEIIKFFTDTKITEPVDFVNDIFNNIKNRYEVSSGSSYEDRGAIPVIVDIGAYIVNDADDLPEQLRDLYKDREVRAKKYIDNMLAFAAECDGKDEENYRTVKEKFERANNNENVAVFSKIIREIDRHENKFCEWLNRTKIYTEDEKNKLKSDIVKFSMKGGSQSFNPLASTNISLDIRKNPETYDAEASAAYMLKQARNASYQTWREIDESIGNYQGTLLFNIYSDVKKRHLINKCIDAYGKKAPIVYKKLKDRCVLLPILEELKGQNTPIKPPSDMPLKEMIEILAHNNFELTQKKIMKRPKEDYVEYLTRITTDKKYASADLEPLKVTPLVETAEELEIKTAELYQYYSPKWRHGNTGLKIIQSFNVDLEFPEFKDFKEKHPNTQIIPAFHGTGSVGASMILRFGFMVMTGKFEKAGKMLGHGIYFTNTLDKAIQYVGDKGMTRSSGTTGYVFEMDAFTGSSDEDFKAAGVGGDGIRSPEWCVFNPRAQLKITKAHKVVIIPRNEAKELAKKHNKTILDEGIYFQKFKKYNDLLKENEMIEPIVDNATPSQYYDVIDFVFMDDRIPVSDWELDDPIQFTKRLAGNDLVSVEHSMMGGSTVSIKNKLGYNGTVRVPSGDEFYRENPEGNLELFMQLTGQTI